MIWIFKSVFYAGVKSKHEIEEFQNQIALLGIYLIQFYAFSISALHKYVPT